MASRVPASERREEEQTRRGDMEAEDAELVASLHVSLPATPPSAAVGESVSGDDDSDESDIENSEVFVESDGIEGPPKVPPECLCLKTATESYT